MGIRRCGSFLGAGATGHLMLVLNKTIGGEGENMAKTTGPVHEDLKHARQSLELHLKASRWLLWPTDPRRQYRNGRLNGRSAQGAIMCVLLWRVRQIRSTRKALSCGRSKVYREQ